MVGAEPFHHALVAAPVLLPVLHVVIAGVVDAADLTSTPGRRVGSQRALTDLRAEHRLSDLDVNFAVVLALDELVTLVMNGGDSYGRVRQALHGLEDLGDVRVVSPVPRGDLWQYETGGSRQFDAVTAGTLFFEL